MRKTRTSRTERRGGTIYGATDDCGYGYYAIENKLDIHDLHATLLHLLGIDHERLTFPFCAPVPRSHPRSHPC